jgi:hypothetical protein
MSQQKTHCQIKFAIKHAIDTSRYRLPPSHQGVQCQAGGSNEESLLALAHEIYLQPEGFADCLQRLQG